MPTVRIPSKIWDSSGGIMTLANREFLVPLQAVPAALCPPAAAPPATPLRFYVHGEQYLAFDSTGDEKAAIARRAAKECAHIQPTPPGVRSFDAGMGDGTVLMRVMRRMHRAFPTAPFLS